MTGAIAAGVVGAIFKAYVPDPDADPTGNAVVVGNIMTFSTVLPCFFSSICYYIAGVYYNEWKIKFIEEKSAAFDNAKAVLGDHRQTSKSIFK